MGGDVKEAASFPGGREVRGSTGQMRATFTAEKVSLPLRMKEMWAGLGWKGVY